MKCCKSRLVKRQPYIELHDATSLKTNLQRMVTTVRNSRRPTAIVYYVTSQKSDSAARTSRPYQSKWRHIQEGWHCRQNLKVLPKYMTSHPRRVTPQPECQRSTKVHYVSSQKSDSAARTSTPYQSTWRHIHEGWHCRQYLKALAYEVNILTYLLWMLHNRKNW